MRYVLALLLLCASCTPPKYKVTCVPVAPQVIGCIAEPMDDKP